MSSAIQRYGLTELYAPEDRKAITLEYEHFIFRGNCSLNPTKLVIVYFCVWIIWPSLLNLDSHRGIEIARP